MINLIIPAAGAGSRFKEAGYDKPKPLIDVCGDAMIHRVLDNVIPETQVMVTLVTRKEDHIKVPRFGTTYIVELEEETGGAVETILKARKHIDAESGLIIANCDQLVAFDVNDFIAKAAPDGSLVTFKSNKPHHSYVKEHQDTKTDSVYPGDIITAIKEKEVISNHAVTGIYYFTKGADFLEAADEVINEDKRVKGEYYVSSVIDRMIENGKRLNTYSAPTAILGTPNELQLFEAAVKVGKEVL